MQTGWNIVSIISHPLIMVTYGLILMLLSNPFLFGSATVVGQTPLIAIVMFSTLFIPILSIAMMRVLNLISSLDMDERRDRVAPIFSAGIWYSALYFTISKSNMIPMEFNFFLFGMLISLFICLFINSFFKISLHATGVAGLAMGLFIFYFSGSAEPLLIPLGGQTLSIDFVVVALLAVVLAGLSSSARMYEGAYTLDEIVAGWMAGIAGQVVALYF